MSELVEPYLIKLLTKKFGKDKIGLFTDDGFSCFQKVSGIDSEKIKKEICEIFRQNALNITVECNFVITDFLDIIFDLICSTYYPYREQKNGIPYIHNQSNHLSSIINHNPLMISKSIVKRLIRR